MFKLVEFDNLFYIEINVMKLRGDMKTILVVDDDPDAVVSIRRTLRVNRI